MPGNEYLSPVEKVNRHQLRACLGGQQHAFKGLNPHVRSWFQVCTSCNVARVRGFAGWIWRRHPAQFRTEGIT